MSEKLISQIINGKAPVTPETAIAFERVMGTPAYVWNNLNASYNLHCVEVRTQQEEAKKLAWANKFPIKELKGLSIIKKDAKQDERVGEILRFFGVSDIPAYDNCYGKVAACFRKSKAGQNIEKIATWLRLGEIKASEIATNPYSKSTFESNIHKIRQFVSQNIDEELIERIKEFCHLSGVAFVIIDKIPGIYCWGATKWFNNSKAMLLLSLRCRTDDQFWFSFFHEAAHIIKHKQDQHIYIDYDNNDNEKEQEADRYARDILIPESDYKVFLEKNSFDFSDINSFSHTINVTPSIIIGRLQHDKKLEWKSSLNNFKKSISIENNFEVLTKI